jgi:ubiquinone biosynthesis protein UbiJ
MLEEFANTSHKAKAAMEKLLKGLENEFTEDILKTLLTGMSLVFLLSSTYRKNIENFSGRYLFRSKDNAFSVGAVFENGSMNVVDGPVDSPDITIIFKNPAALRNFIFSPKPDILNAILRQDVSVDGNLNYLYKFAYMANHLKLMAQELMA